MTRKEFSDAFDTMLNSYNTQAVFGDQASRSEIVLDEFEKSVLLTQAQDIIIKSFFTPTSNSEGQGFDTSERRQVDFSSLVTTAVPTRESDQSSKFDDRGILYRMPLNTLYVLNEHFKVGGKVYVVIPINYNEYDRRMTKAYTQPLKKQVWRLFQNQTNQYDITSEIILHQELYDAITRSEDPLTGEYIIRYVKRPAPIILEDLHDNLEIDGVSTASDCTLNPILHREILNKAVELAIATRGGRQVPQEQPEMRRRYEQ